MKLRAVLILATMVLGGMLVSGVALARTCNTDCGGSNSRDILNGTGNKNQMAGYGGNDYINGMANADRLWGGDGSDTLRGGDGNDVLEGQAGTDDVNGGPGDDKVWGHDGRRQGEDNIDQLKGGSDDDVIVAVDNDRDHINCGAGRDTAYVDPRRGPTRDTWDQNCEEVIKCPNGPTGDCDNGKEPPEPPPGEPPPPAQTAGELVGKEARLVGQMESASGPRVENGIVEQGG
jgi:RTX calcium-binding nonapeptide repeat (4 copies)